MKASFNDHVITIRPVHTESGRVAAPGTHGFILRVLTDPDERYVAELYLDVAPDDGATELTVLLPLDFDVV